MESASHIHDRVLISLRQIIRAIDLHSRKLVKNHNLTGPQLTILKELQQNGHCSIGNLAKQVHLSNATVTGIIDRLETRGYVQRVRDRVDRRKVYIDLTDAAGELLKKAPSLLQDHFIDALDSMTPEDQAQIMETLEKIAAMMGAEKMDAAPMLLIHDIPISEAKLRDQMKESAKIRNDPSGEVVRE